MGSSNVVILEVVIYQKLDPCHINQNENSAQTRTDGHNSLGEDNEYYSHHLTLNERGVTVS